jgi:hypothetical protein
MDIPSIMGQAYRYAIMTGKAQDDISAEFKEATLGTGST